MRYFIFWPFEYRLIRTDYKHEHRRCGGPGLLAAVRHRECAPEFQVPQEIVAQVPAVAPRPQGQITTLPAAPPLLQVPAKLHPFSVTACVALLTDSKGVSGDQPADSQHMHGGAGAAAELQTGGAVRGCQLRLGAGAGVGLRGQLADGAGARHFNGGWQEGQAQGR